MTDDPGHRAGVRPQPQRHGSTNNINGSGSLTQAGSGTLSLTGANSYGATTVSTGTLQVGDGNAGSLGTGNVTDAAALVFDTTTGNNLTIGNTIDGGGSLTRQVPIR